MGMEEGEMKPIRPEVFAFAQAMSRRLDENEHRSRQCHWGRFGDEELVKRARKNLRRKGRDEVDAANYCMMIFDNDLNRLSYEK